MTYGALSYAREGLLDTTVQIRFECNTMPRLGLPKSHHPPLSHQTRILYKGM
jgi:hypothetical protein